MRQDGGTTAPHRGNGYASARHVTQGVEAPPVNPLTLQSTADASQTVAPQGHPPSPKEVLDGTIRIILSPETKLEDKFKAYEVFRSTDYSKLSLGDLIKIADLTTILERHLVFPVYANARNLDGTKPLHIPLEQVLARLNPALKARYDAAGITEGKIYAHCTYIAAEERTGRNMPQLLRGLHQGSFAHQDIVLTGLYVQEIAALAEKSSSKGAKDDFKGNALSNYYTAALTYVGAGFKTFLSGSDDQLFSDKGLEAYAELRKILDCVVDANDKLQVDVPQGWGFNVKDSPEGEQRQIQFNLDDLLAQLESMMGDIYATRKIVFKKSAEKIEDEKCKRAEEFWKYAAERYNSDSATKTKLNVDENTNFRELFEKNKQFSEYVIREAMESMRVALSFIGNYSRILENDSKVIDGFIHNVVTRYKEETGQEHPFVVEQEMHRRVMAERARDKSLADYIRGVDAPKADDTQQTPPAIHAPRRRSKFTFGKVPKLVYAALAAVGLAGAAYMHYSDSVKTNPGYLVGDINNDGKTETVEVSIKSVDPFEIGYKVRENGGSTGTPQSPEYIVVAHDGKVKDKYKPTLFKLIDTLGSTKTHSSDSCADIAISAPNASLVIYRGDCKGNFSRK